MNNSKLRRISDECFLVTHPDGTWEIIHEDRVVDFHQA